VNPVVIIHLLAAALAIVIAVPLIRGRVGRNHWYGVRIPAAFVSDEAWFELNRYGGRLLLIWGFVIAATAAVGAGLGKKDWITYNWAALVISLGGLAVVVALIFRHGRLRPSA